MITKIKSIAFLLYFFGSFGQSFAQDNLIINGDFEELQPQANLNTQFRLSQLVTGWREIAAGEIGYIHEHCSIFKPNKNPLGVQAPQSGKGYVFLKVLGLPFGEYGDLSRFYLQTKLKAPLEAGKVYELQFYVSFSDVAKIAIENLDVFFFEKPIQKMGDAPNPLYSPTQSSSGKALDLLETTAITQLKNQQGILTNSEAWVAITHKFTAKGGETFMVVGNFELQGRVHHQTFDDRKEQWKWKDSYYFLDNFSLTSTTEPPVVLANPPLTELQDVSFETNKATLLPAAQAPLANVVSYMQENPSATIIIEGHTDNTGDSLLNLKLSVLRAEAVKNYLETKGIKSQRMEVSGFGSQLPLLPNNSPNNRKRNRRVVVRKKRK